MALASWKRARTAERDAAVELINAAFTDGQLTEEQREDRVHRALVATHVGDLDQVTVDLRGAVVPVRRARWWRRIPRRVTVAVGALVLVVAGGIAVAELTDDPAPAPPVHQEYTVPAEDLGEVIDAQAGAFHTTESYGVVLGYPLSTITVPTQDGRARYQQWRLTEGGFKEVDDVRAAGEHLEFDLADVDLDALEVTLAEAESTLGVPEPVDSSLSIQHWADADQPTIVITVSNEFQESAYVVTDLDGKVLERRPFDPSGG